MLKCFVIQYTRLWALFAVIDLQVFQVMSHVRSSNNFYYTNTLLIRQV